VQGKLVERGAAAIEQIALMLAIDQNFRPAGSARAYDRSG
jgi:hypothetical protein